MTHWEPTSDPDRREFLGYCMGIGGAVALSIGTPQPLAAASLEPIVQTREGMLRGMTSAGLNIFKGVRYGESPTGPSRFRQAVPVRPWRDVRPAAQLGAPALQDNPDPAVWQDPVQPSEDCLFLNIWAPRSPGPHPVMVFFHGGAFAWGSGGIPMYDGGALAERGEVVVITLNHRINVFGYLYLAGLSANYASDANPGHRDLVEGLRWIRRNIAAFGGDPRNITIFGESGGGAKVSLMLATPMAEGLFHKAIVQSGSLLQIRTPDVATAEAAALLKELNIPPTALDRLASIPSDAIMQAYRAVRDRQHGDEWLGLPFAPTLDPLSIPLQPAVPRSRERWTNIPLLVGTTTQEAVAFMAVGGRIPEPQTDKDVIVALTAAPGRLDLDRAQRLVAASRANKPDASPQQLLVDIRSFNFFRGKALLQAELKTELDGAPVYMYEFAWKEPCLGGQWAIHGADLPFVFDKLEASPVYDETDTPALRARSDPEGLRYKLRDAVMDAWIGFARSGTPGNRHLPDWPVYTASDRAVMRFNGTSVLVHDPFGPQLRELAIG